MSEQKDPVAKDGIRMFFIWLAVLGGILAPLWFIIAPVGTKLGLWGWPFALGKMSFQWGPKVLIAGAVLTGLAIILSLIKSPRLKPLLFSLIPVVMIGAFLAVILPKVEQGRRLPPIHDVQTDWSDPVSFSDSMMATRGDEANPVLVQPIIPESAKARWPDYAGMPVADAQRKAYPDIKSFIAPVPADILYSAAFATLTAEGIEIVTNDEAGLRLEGTHTSFWYDFKDDVVVRIQPKGEGSQIDIRSTSRVGLSDLGANATRVRGILEGVKQRLQLSEE